MALLDRKMRKAHRDERRLRGERTQERKLYLHRVFSQMRGRIQLQSGVLLQQLAELDVGAEPTAGQLPHRRRRHRAGHAEAGVIRTKHDGAPTRTDARVRHSGDGAAVLVSRMGHHDGACRDKVMTPGTEKTRDFPFQGDRFAG